MIEAILIGDLTLLVALCISDPIAPSRAPSENTLGQPWQTLVDFSAI